jgi:hypothetical protein
MSQEELQEVKNVLKGVLNPDNIIRNEAEKKLSVLRNTPSAFCYYLSKVLSDVDSEKGMKTLASVLLRKLLAISEKEMVSPTWKSIDENFKNSIKENILNAVINEVDKSQKLKFCDTMATVAENVFDSKEGWVDLFNFIYQGISLPLEPANVSNIETVLFLISQIFGLVYEEMITKLDAFISTFEGFFKYEDFGLKTRTAQVIGEILSVVRKKDSKKFKHFIPIILEHTYKCLTTPNKESFVSIIIFNIINFLKLA